MLFPIVVALAGCAAAPSYVHPADDLRDHDGSFVGEVSLGDFRRTPDDEGTLVPMLAPYLVYFVGDGDRLYEHGVHASALIASAKDPPAISAFDTFPLQPSPVPGGVYSVEILGATCIWTRLDLASVELITTTGETIPSLSLGYAWKAPDMNGHSWYWFQRARFPRGVPVERLAAVVVTIEDAGKPFDRVMVPLR